MARLQPLRAEHAPALLAFELANRAYFASAVSDRGDDFYVEFDARHSALIAEQQAGVGAYYLLVDEDGSILGRFNLWFAEDGTARLGYRVAEHVAGQGVASANVREICQIAAQRHGLHKITAAVSYQNVASQKVLTKSGFVQVGRADPTELGGKAGMRYERLLVDDPAETRG